MVPILEVELFDSYMLQHLVLIKQSILPYYHSCIIILILQQITMQSTLHIS